MLFIYLSNYQEIFRLFIAWRWKRMPARNFGGVAVRGIPKLNLLPNRRRDL
jgi:hypothetical protein